MGLKKHCPTFNEYSIFIILIIASIITRFYNLGTWNFWYDEIFTLNDTIKLNFTNIFNNHKPVYYALCKVSFSIFGINEWSARLFSAVSGVLAIPVFYLILKKISNVKTALLTSAFVLFSPWHLFHSQSARFYSTVFLLGGLSAFLFYYSNQTKRHGVLILSFFIALIGVLTHTTVVFIFPSMFLFLIIYYLFDSKFMAKKGIIILLFAATIAGCLLVPLAIKVAKGWFGMGLSWGYSPAHLIMAIASYIGIPIIIMACVTLVMLIYEQHMLGYFLLCYTLVPFVFIVIIGQFSNVRPDYIFFTIPGYFLLAAIGCSRVYDILRDKQSILAKGFICVLLTTNAPSFVSYYSDGNRHPVKEASEYIVNKMDSTDIVLCKSPSTIEYYFNIDAKPLTLEHLNSYRDQRRQVWILVLYNRSGMYNIEYEIKDWIYENCSMVKEFIPKRFDYIDNSVRIFKLL